MATAKNAGSLAALGDALARRAVHLPPARTRYMRRQGVPVPMRDGIALLTDHYAPQGTTARGTVLVRTPYGRGLPMSLLYGRMFAARGYHVLIQSCRGTGGSPGDFRPVAQEVDDAQDAAAWLRAQDWFNGRLATLGGSYLGWSQWALMLDPPPELCAAVVIVGPHDFGRAAYGSGAFLLRDLFGWSASVLAQSQRNPVRALAQAAASGRRVNAAVNRLPLTEAADAAGGGRAPWLREWIAHTDLSDPFWAPYSADKALQRTETPTLLIGGWQDLFLDQTLEQYRVLRERGVQVALTIGPWTHLDSALRASAVINAEALAWFDTHLSREPGADGEAAETRARVRAFITGADTWRDLPAWPPPTTERSYRLHTDATLSDLDAGPSGAGTVAFVYDPADPTPAIGGRTMSAHAGVQDNSALEDRPDVTAFTGAPLRGTMEIAGRPVVRLTITTDHPHNDVFVRLCDVDQRGRSRNVCDAYLRLDPERLTDVPTTATLELDACAHRFAAGHRLRLLIAGACHPRFARNLGTGEPAESGTRVQPSQYRVHCPDSSITLPVVDA